MMHESKRFGYIKTKKSYNINQKDQLKINSFRIQRIVMKK